MTTYNDFLNEIADDLELLDRQEQLLALRQYGDYLERPPERLFADENHVPGCASPTFVDGWLKPDGKMHFEGYSESFISRGYVYILLKAFEDVTPETLVEAEPDVMAFAERAGVRLSTITSRANAFQNIYRQMQVRAALRKPAPDGA